MYRRRSAFFHGSPLVINGQFRTFRKGLDCIRPLPKSQAVCRNHMVLWDCVGVWSPRPSFPKPYTCRFVEYNGGLLLESHISGWQFHPAFWFPLHVKVCVASRASSSCRRQWIQLCKAISLAASAHYVRSYGADTLYFFRWNGVGRLETSEDKTQSTYGE